MIVTGTDTWTKPRGLPFCQCRQYGYHFAAVGWFRVGNTTKRANPVRSVPFLFCGVDSNYPIIYPGNVYPLA